MATGSAFARAALAGNPSDGHGGAVLALCVPSLAAHAEAQPAPETRSDPPSALVDAAVARSGRGPCAVRWAHERPARGRPRRLERDRHGGGAALCALHGHVLAPDALAEMVLAVEVEDLGIAAGPQDRYAQAHEGLVLMDFAGATRRWSAWTPRCCRTSTSPGAPTRPRPPTPCTAACASGRTIPRLRAGMGRLGGHARAARDALLSGDHAAFARAVDASFDERAALLDLDPRHVAMVRAARATGASANYAGSGGAIVGTLPSAGLEPVSRALRALGCEMIAPSLPL